MDKIIRASNLQKALEDYDSLKGQPVIFVYTLPESPNIRTRVYCKQDVTTVTELFDLKIEGLVEEFADEYATGQYVIKSGYTVKYHNTNVDSVEISQGTVTLYEDQFTTALTDSFNLTDKYTFDVTLTVTEMAYYIGDGTNQSLYPVVTFGVIEEVKSKIEKVYNTLDNKIDNSYNTLDAKIDNEISNIAVNFTTDNLVANVATVNSASIDNAQVNNFDVSTLIANGSTGSDGQYLGKNNGNIEWVTPPFDTNHLYVNHLTVNNNSFTDNATINNMVVNNATLPRTVTVEVSYSDSNGQPVEDPHMIEYLSHIFGNPGISSMDYNLQFLPFIIMPESSYLGSFIGEGNITWNGYEEGLPGFYAYMNVISDPLFAFVATAPFGNIYFAGKKIADANCDVKVEGLKLSGIRLNNTSISTAKLAFTDAPVTNNNKSGTLAIVTSILGSDVDYTIHGNLPYGVDVNRANGVITTNVKNTSFATFDDLFSGSSSMTDCFITNQSLILNAPSGYNVWSNVTSMSRTFFGCYNFNQPITIPNSVTSMGDTFAYCRNFNQPITIPNSVTSMGSTFRECTNFNQPITIPNSVTRMLGTFSNCGNFNQPITIPNSVTSMDYMFEDCTKLASSSVPIHISHEIALGDTSNYIYNSLVNGLTGIPFAPSRILNDA